jgi:hypothetical protein
MDLNPRSRLRRARSFQKQVQIFSAVNHWFAKTSRASVILEPCPCHRSRPYFRVLRTGSGPVFNDSEAGVEVLGTEHYVLIAFSSQLRTLN